MSLTPTVLLDVFISINSNTISDHGNKIEVPLSADVLETTCFGQTFKTRVGGLKDGVVNISLLNDFTASNLNANMYQLLGTVVPFEIRPTSSARSATNPSLTGFILINAWNPLSGSVGDLDSMDMSFPTSSTVNLLTS
jgi:hypothetical protein